MKEVHNVNIYGNLKTILFIKAILFIKNIPL